METQIGRLYVRRSILIEAPPARVWQEFGSEERIKKWFNLGHTIHKFEPEVGGQAELSVSIDGEERFFGGRVLVYEANREITIESQWYEPYAFPAPTYWTIRLTPLYGGTQVEIFHHGFDQLGRGAADALEGYEGGWDVKHLKALRALVGASRG